jgi:hypothetical protein
MNTILRDVVDIDAFTKGLAGTTMSLGLIIPIYGINMGASMLSAQVGNQYLSSVVGVLGEIFKWNVMLNHSR